MLGSEADWTGRIGAARRQGNHLAAFDLSQQALEAFPGALFFEHQAILALARAGALGGALDRYNKLLATGRIDAIDDPVLSGEFAGLGGRLFKDIAARSNEDAALGYRLTSSRTYEAGFQRCGGYYLAINAATMFLAAGHATGAAKYAGIAHLLAAESHADYWSTATQAEALLILGDLTGAAKSLREAANFSAGNLDELASTRRQLAWICQLLEIAPDILDDLPGPRILNWVSRPGGLDADLKYDFEPGRSVLAFGPLLTAADLTIACTLLKAGAKLHLVLPCAPALLASRICSDVPALSDMFDALLTHSDVDRLLVTAEGGPSEPAAHLLCQQQARGLALLRAQSLAVTPELISFSNQVFSFSGISSDNNDLYGIMPDANYPADQIRKSHAILFGDVRGFSKLSETEQLRFLEHVIGGFADILDGTPDKEYAETAGDGLFIVVADVISAIECCFALREKLPQARAAGNLPADLGIRLSAHIGPLYKRLDRIIGREKFCGMEVIRTARIEPITPVGEIFVTEQFAAALACTADGEFICEYVGIQPLAKGFGECRMYSLRRVRH